MKENKLIIQIRRKPKDIFDFCLNPKNTPKWISSIIIEETSEWPVKVGSMYRNQNKQGIWSEYTMIVLQSPTMFEFASASSTYHVRYTLRSLSIDITELEYFEWMEEGELKEPFTIDILEKLKNAIEE